MSASRVKPEVDLSQPASLVLRAGTIGIHDEISNSKTATYLTKGELDREEYVRYLMMLWHVYKVLEEGLAAKADDRILSLMYNPALLARGSALSSDISFFLGVADDDNSWKTHETHKHLISSPPPAFQAYISRLTEIVQEDSVKLLAHSYIRYLGDLSGGQVMKLNIRKAYGLVDDQGTRFYNFGEMGREGETNPAPANLGEVKRIKEWFKNGMDVAIGNDVEMKETLLAETTRAYFLHKDLFDEIEAASSKKRESGVSYAPPTAQKSSVDQKSTASSRMFSVGSVLTFMFAVGLAHFLIVVGGLSGSLDYAKLETVQAWVASLSN